jgi:excisionase family DNA binding protein
MRLISAREACESLGIRLARLYQLTREGVVPCVRLGERQLRFDPEVLAAWSKKGGLSNRELATSGVTHGKS